MRRTNRLLTRPWAHGMTLIELMVVLAVVAILVAAASPAYNTAIANNRLDAWVNQFEDALRFARTEAMRRSEEVYVQPHDPLKWSDDFSVFIETRSSRVPTELRRFAAFKPGYVFKGPVPDQILFDRIGRTIRWDTGALIGNTDISVCVGSSGRTVSIAQNAQFTVQNAAQGVCP